MLSGFESHLSQNPTSTLKHTMPSVVDLVEKNLQDRSARHLMLLTEGDAATCLLRIPQVAKALNNPVVMYASRFKNDDSSE